MVDLRKAPYNLDDEGIKWVENTIASMTLDEKVGQLFTLLQKDPRPDSVKEILTKHHQGGHRWTEHSSEDVFKQIKFMQENSKIPLLVAANCDDGGNGVAKDGTFIATPAQAGASLSEETAYNMGLVSGKEATSVGCNWLFNPLVDIFMNWRNSIVNTRSFSDNADDVIKYARAYMKGAHESNIACCGKHFPGDGVEERDQHLVMGVNDLSVEDWENSFGKVYQTLIDEGLESIMVGHIALPEMTRKLRPGIKDHDIMPATFSKELLTDLLREKMGFNGLVLTDASHMVGFTATEKREIALPKSIAAGCDMILFANDIEEDMGYVKKAIDEGTITQERLQDALSRILGLKAKLKLYKRENIIIDETIREKVIGCQEHLKLQEKAADDCITLVKDTKQYLPINPNKQKRAYLVYVQSTPTSKGFTGDPVKPVVLEELQKAGFDVTVADNFHDLEIENGVKPTNKFRMMTRPRMKDFSESYDVVFLVINVTGYAQENNVRIRWSSNHSSEFPWYVTEVPTVGISLNYTTHLIDVPQVKTFVNAYGSTRTSIKTAIEKVCGKSEFKGKANDTVFCGKWDTRL